MANSIAYAEVFQSALDDMIVQESTTAWMDENASQVIYTGGKTVKIPKMTLTGLGNYGRNDGYKKGSVTLAYEPREMTQDRGTQFLLDKMDVDETNFAATAIAVMAQFQREAVIPEVDAYRISKIASTAITAGQHVEYGYTPDKTTILAKLKAAIDVAGPEAVIMATPEVTTALEVAVGTNNLSAETFMLNGIDTRLPSLDGHPIIKVESNRMITAIQLNDLSNGTGGGWAKGATGKNVNFIVLPRFAPIGVNKLDEPQIFEPEQVQDYSAWKINYRRYHDLWIMDNKASKIALNVKDTNNG